MSAFLSSRQSSFRALCWLLALQMFVMPSLPVLAQQVDEPELGIPDTTLLADPTVLPLDLSYVLPQACVVVSMRPRKMLTSPAMQMLPIEVLQAASLQQSGIDPLETEALLLSVEPPMAGPPNYAVMVVFTPDHKGKLHPQLTAHTQPDQIDGHQYLKSQHPLLPSFLTIDGDTLLAAPDLTLQKLVGESSSNGESLLLSRLKGELADDLYADVDFQSLRPLINQLIMQKQQEVPSELRPFLAAPDLIRLVEFRLNPSGTAPNELIVEANSEADATRLIGMLRKAVDMWRTQALAATAQLKQDPDPVQQALGRYQERLMSQTSEMVVPEQEGARLILFRQVPGDGDNSALTTMAISGILVALLLPAVQAAREAARRNMSLNNLKQIMLALLNSESAHGHYPAQANFDENGKPLLSWRVHILPFLEESRLYEQFHLDEPWDSEHNRKLIAKMPEVFLDSSSKFSPQEGRTHYLGVQGEHNVFSGTEQGRKLAEITDGTSNTIMVLQVNDKSTVPWTKPVDWKPDDKDPRHGLTGSMHPGLFHAAFCDGSVRAMSEQIDAAGFKRVLTIDGND